MSPLLKTPARADLFAQLAAMELAGLPPQKAWGLIKLPQGLQTRVATVQKALQRGTPLATAAQRAGLFSPIEAHLVRAALEAGSPGPAYRRLADRCQQRAKREGALRSRMALPIAVLLAACVIGPIPQWVNGSLTLGGYLWQVFKPLLALAPLAAAAMYFIANPHSRAWLLKLPLVGPALARGQARDFFESLGLLLQAGVAMFEALPLAAATVGQPGMREAFEGLLPRLKSGLPLAESLETLSEDPLSLGNPRVIDMVATGEASGTLPEMLLRHTDAESNDLDRFWSDLVQWLPRLAYAAVACWIAYGLLKGAGFGPTTHPEATQRHAPVAAVA